MPPPLFQGMTAFQPSYSRPLTWPLRVLLSLRERIKVRDWLLTRRLGSRFS